MARVIAAVVGAALASLAPLSAQNADPLVSPEPRLSAPGAPAAEGDLNAGRDAPEASGVVDLPRLTSPITLDGILDEAEWAGIPALPLTMYEPTFRGETGRQITLRVAYDDEAVYVAARFYHEDPDDIRAFSVTRDTWNGDDGFGLFLDTFLDKENAVRFVGLPLGARMDMSISGDGLGERGSGGPAGISWNTFWDLQTEFLDDGWSGEMRVPFASLRFESQPDGSVVMGMMAYAYEPAQERRFTFPAIPRSKQYTQVSAFQDVRFQGITPRNPVFVTGYGLAGNSLQRELSPAQDRWDRVTNTQQDFGVDMKINPNPNLTLDLTLNTDFAAVEADDQQVNLTRFNLFFDEKRPFFQERAGIFTFATGADRGTLFYSRRIGLANGAPVPIIGGARLVGRIGNWDVGAIDMVTDEFQGAERENFGVLRLRRRVLNPQSFVGGMLTSRIAGNGVYNHTYGVDALLRVTGNEFLTVKLLQTLQGGDAVSDAAPGGLDAGRLVLDWTRRQAQGFSYQHALTWSGAGYDPGMGFELRQDFLRAESNWNYQWFPGEDSPFRRVWLGANNSAWRRNLDGVWETGRVEPFLQLESKSGTTFRVLSRTRLEDVLADFSLSADTNVPAGRYWATEGEAQFRSPRGWAIRPNLTVSGGEFFDGLRTRVNTSFDWPVNRYLGLRGSWEWNRVRFDERDQAFDANVVRLSTRLALDIHLSVDLFTQYNSLTDQLTTNTRFRYQFREGQDLWLVWNEGLNLERDVLGVPRLPFESARTLTVKYTHTLIF